MSTWYEGDNAIDGLGALVLGGLEVAGRILSDGEIRDGGLNP